MKSKNLVEEFMLLANIQVAEFLFKYCKDKTLLRAHSDIEEDKKIKLMEFFKKINLKGIDLSNSMTLSKSMDRLAAEGREDDLHILNRKFLTFLKQATYVTVEERDPWEFAHYGLNFPIYTHFTSPIRRYADLLVHRLITISLKERGRTRQLIDQIDYQYYAQLCTEKSLNARKAGKESQRLFHCLLLKQEGGCRVYDSLVYDLDAQFLYVYIDEINIHLKVNFKDDPRFHSSTLHPDEFLVQCFFTSRLELAPGYKNYD